MSLLAVPLIAVIALVIALITPIILAFKINTLKSKVNLLENQQQSNDIFISEMQNSLSQLKNITEQIAKENSQTIIENEQVSKQLEHRIKTIQGELAKHQALFQQYQEQQPEDKLYSRAYKLAALGADLEEIMRECELPRAEVEMLLSVYTRST